ncbi:hypothetical protein, partial [Xanthomonas oryzae]|uniref:hypothetical protein n=1 Tax=Xanthomonas oryzae TaxID=347 RepID=UPI00117C2A59
CGRAPQRAQASCGQQTWHLVFERVFQGPLLLFGPSIFRLCQPNSLFQAFPMKNIFYLKD